MIYNFYTTFNRRLEIFLKSQGGHGPSRPPNQPILRSSRCESQSLPMPHALDQDVKYT